MHALGSRTGVQTSAPLSDLCDLVDGRHGFPVLLLEVGLSLLMTLLASPSGSSSQGPAVFCPLAKTCKRAAGQKTVGVLKVVRSPLVPLLPISGRPDLPQLLEVNNDPR